MPTITLLTKHKKAQWIAPALKKVGYTVIESDKFDTDSLGTFSGEIERTLSPKAAALSKAQKACELTDSDWGLGSEGSFGGGPAPGLVNWNDEVLCLYQRSSGITVYAFGSGPSPVSDIYLQHALSVEEQMGQHPEQNWILRTAKSIEKGLSCEQVIRLLKTHVDDSDSLKIEPDLRAMHCPSRQAMIEKAATDLARRLSTKCPQCHSVNFVIKDKQPGLPCAMCSLPTHFAKSYSHICDVCNFCYVEAVAEEAADPTHCQLCNP